MEGREGRGNDVNVALMIEISRINSNKTFKLLKTVLHTHTERGKYYKMRKSKTIITQEEFALESHAIQLSSPLCGYRRVAAPPSHLSPFQCRCCL